MLITFKKLDQILGFKSGYTWLMARNGWKNAKGFKLDNQVWVMHKEDALKYAEGYGKKAELQKYINERQAEYAKYFNK